MFSADAITAERKNRRALSFWRIVAILALMVAFLAIIVVNPQSRSQLAKYSHHIARLRIDGLITGDQKTIDLLAKIEKSKRVKALIVRINSPGGTTVGSEALYDSLRKVAAKKPVVAVMDSVAASGGFIAALASDHVIARGNTITGSIGVIFQWPEVDQLLGKVGVNMQTIKSGPQKAEPNIYKPLRPEVRPVLEAMVKDSFKWFVKLVADRRKIPHDEALRLADGRVYTGRQALAVKLIDELGNEDSAVKWLQKEKKISKKLKITTWKVVTTADKVGISLSSLAGVARFFGFRDLARYFDTPAPVAQRGLDGLLAVWQPALR